MAQNDVKPYAPLFLQQTYGMVNDPTTDDVIAWSGPDSFIIKDQNALASDVLPKYFKHNNFSSFVRQLNGYGFRKVTPEAWNFQHSKFVRGQPQLLREMTRRKTPKSEHPQGTPSKDVAAAAASLPPSVASLVSFPTGQLNLTGDVNEALVAELENMRKTNRFLMEEIIRLRQNQEELTRRFDDQMENVQSKTEQNRANINAVLSLMQAAIGGPTGRRSGVLDGPSRSASFRLLDDTSAAVIAATPPPPPPLAATPTAAQKRPAGVAGASGGGGGKRVSLRTSDVPSVIEPESPLPGGSAADNAAKLKLKTLADAATEELFQGQEFPNARRTSSGGAGRRTQSASALLEEKNAELNINTPTTTLPQLQIPGTPLLGTPPPLWAASGLDSGADMFGVTGQDGLSEFTPSFLMNPGFL